MKLRKLLFILFVFAATYSVTIRKAVAELAILQGATSESETQISILAPKTSQLPVFSVFDAALEQSQAKKRLQGLPIHRHQFEERPFSEWVFHKVTIKGLILGRAYRLEVRSATGELLDARYFQALDRTLVPARIAFVSCMKDSKKNQAEMWKALIDARPQMIVFLGDNVYGDLKEKDPTKMSESLLWNRYVETRTTLAIFKASNLIPSIATWDDHDTGVNNVLDSTHKRNFAGELKE